MSRLFRASDWLQTFQRERVFLILAGFVVFVAVVGGGSRADVASLLILRPVSVLVCGLALLSMSAAPARNHRASLAVACALLVLAALHLLPLPSEIWSILPGRNIVVEIGSKFELGNVWRPLALVPAGAWNAFYSLFTPIAVLLLGIQLDPLQLRRLIKLILIIGLFSGLFGLIQAAGDQASSAYLYRITNRGSAVGLFANRNHQALFLATLLPMLSVYAGLRARTPQQASIRRALAIGGAAATVPLLLITGSRAGLVLGVCGLIAGALLYRAPHIETAPKRKHKRFDWRLPVTGATLVCLAGLVALSARTEAFQRLFNADPADEQRFKIWSPALDMAWRYFPFGSGIGSFPEVYAMDEPEALLSPTYMNHAHNDYLEIFLTAGLPGIFLLAIVVGALLLATLRVWRTPVAGDGDSFGRLGSVILAMMAIASTVDYPLRTPFLACVFVIAVLCVSPWWQAAGGRTRPAARRGDNIEARLN